MENIIKDKTCEEVFNSLPEYFVIFYNNKYIPFEKIDNDILDVVSYKSILLDGIIDDIAKNPIYINYDENSFKLTKRVFSHIDIEMFENSICANHTDVLFNLYKVKSASELCGFFNLSNLTPYTFNRYKQIASNLFRNLSNINSYKMFEINVLNNTPSQLPIYYMYTDVSNKKSKLDYTDVLKDVIAYVLDKLTFSRFTCNNLNKQFILNTNKDEEILSAYINKNVDKIDWDLLDYLIHII